MLPQYCSNLFVLYEYVLYTYKNFFQEHRIDWKRCVWTVVAILLYNNFALESRDSSRRMAHTMIRDKKRIRYYQAGMVLKDRLQLGNMWQSDHLSRKRTPPEFARAEIRRRDEVQARFSSSLLLRLPSCILPRCKTRAMSHYAWLARLWRRISGPASLPRAQYRLSDGDWWNHRSYDRHSTRSREIWNVDEIHRLIRDEPVLERSVVKAVSI